MAQARAYHGLGLAYLIGVRKIASSDAEDSTIVANAEKAVELRERIEDFAGAGDSLNLLGSIYQCQKKYSRAEKYFLQSLSYRERVLSRFDPDLGQVSVSLGKLYCEMGDYHKAKEYFIRAREIYSAALGDSHPRVCHALEGLAQVYEKSKCFGSAHRCLLQACAIYQAVDSDVFISDLQRVQQHLKQVQFWVDSHQQRTPSSNLQIGYSSGSGSGHSHGHGRRRERAVTPFVSSTFRDMHGERELLISSVFPELEMICSQRRVAFSPRDFRWGITSSEVSRGRVITRCLNEIDQSYPWFILILGHRYGWCPTEKSDESQQLLQKQFVMAQNEYPWIENWMTGWKAPGLRITSADMQYLQ